MRHSQFWSDYRRITFLIIDVMVLTAITFVSAPTEKVVYSFLGSSETENPTGGLVADSG